MSKNRGNIGPIAALAAAAATVAAYAVYLLADFTWHEHDTREYDSLIALRFASGDPARDYIDREVNEKIKPLNPLLELIAAYEKELQAEYNYMKMELASSDIEKIVSMAIDYPDSIETSKAKLADVNKILNKHHSNFDRISARTALAIKKLKPADAGQQPLIDGIYKLIAGGDCNINEYFMIQDSIIDDISKLQTFLSDKKGKYRFKGEEIIFDNKKEQNEFNKYGNRLLELWQTESGWIFRIKQQQGIVDEKIHTQIEDFLL